ncbi:MAG: type III-A CRISPR-associated protein Csm2 [bacterium]|nr:type III-A CRISPR-associated protein Csm2 [bacterium]
MEQRGGKERSQHRESQDQADEVRRTIEKLQTLKDLQPELFAFEDGLASKIASAGRMKFNQIRKFFGHVKNLESKIKGKKGSEKIDPEFKRELDLLIPELVYGVARDVVDEKFYRVMEVCIRQKIKTFEDFERFVEFLTAIIAYYKYKEKRG